MKSAFTWISGFLHELESRRIPFVYLRNYETLPQNIGNDVDLLIAGEGLGTAVELALEFASRYGWRHLKSVEFGPISMFFADEQGTEFLHIDLFTRLEWHFLPMADPKKILARRRWNGQVFIPDPLDELYLNVTTRLFYHGVIRAKHRAQADQILMLESHEHLLRIFQVHLGKRAAHIMTPLVLQRRWSELENLTPKLRRLLWLHAVGKPMESVASVLLYLRRGISRILFPPGPFLVFEGADGVGKSTVIAGLLPMMKDLTGRSDTLLFHWKPTLKSIRIAGEAAGASQDPRGKTARPLPLALLFLGYHWLGFWSGYLRYILPARARNRAVLGDRYVYEFFLDPARLRLQVPDCLARLAAATVPKPDLVICQVANPQQIIARKPELSEDEINQYQGKLKAMANANPECVILDADGNVAEVLAQARKILLQKLFAKC